MSVFYKTKFNPTLEYKFLKRIGIGASAKVYKIMKRSDK
jgi:hypothetical protein